MIFINGYVHISPITVIRYVKVARHATYVESVRTVRTKENYLENRHDGQTIHPGEKIMNKK